MTDPDALAPATDPAAAPFSPEVTAASPPVAATPALAERRSRWPWRLAGLIAVLLLAGGEAYLFRLYHARPDPSGQIAALQSEVTALQQQQQAEVAAPTPVPPAPPTPAAAAALPAQFGAALTALQAQFAVDHAALASLQSNAIDTGKLNAELGAVQTETSLDHATLSGLQATLVTLGRQTSKLAALGRMDAAANALAAGQPLGEIPNAPPALARYADTPPPTEAALRLAFPAAARAAATASVNAGKRGYWAVVKARLENLVTISNGSHVIVGAPAAAALAQAQARLDVGDLAGAVTLLNTLSPPAQQAMGDWLAQARGLVAARAVLAGPAEPQ